MRTLVADPIGTPDHYDYEYLNHELGQWQQHDYRSERADNAYYNSGRKAESRKAIHNLSQLVMAADFLIDYDDFCIDRLVKEDYDEAWTLLCSKDEVDVDVEIYLKDHFPAMFKEYFK